MEVAQACMNGVTVYARSDFVKLYPDILHATQLITTRTNTHMLDKFADVTWQSDQVVYVSQGSKVVAPIQLQTIVDHTQSLGAERITIVVEKDAQVTIHDMPGRQVDGQVANVSPNHATRLIEVIVRDYAQVTFVSHQDHPTSVNDFSTLYFYLGTHSTVQYASLLTGSHFSTSWLDVIMEGEHAHADLCGVWLLDGARTIDMTTMQQHLGAHNTSRLRIKSAVRDHARSVYRGTVHIAVDAHGTHAAQENKNILLSEHASAYSIPNLEALNNDVYCAHGTAVGQLDEEQLLYMQARGIEYKQAQQMLLQGFLADAIPHFLDEATRAAFMARIAQWLA